MIWVEILSRHKEVIARSRHDGDALQVGRAYDNDVIIDDPCSAPHHLRLQRDSDGIWVATDLDTINGILDVNNRRLPQIVLDGDTLIRIGHTWLRVRDTRHPVAPERRMAPPQRLWPWLLVLGVFVFGSTLLEMWLNDSSEPRLSVYLLPVVSLLVMLVIWVSIWAGLTRLLTGAAHFMRHAIIALTGLVVATVLENLISWATFAFSARLLIDSSFVLYWALFGIVCFFHLRVISPRHARLKMILLAVLCMAAAAVQWLAKDPFNELLGNQGGNPYLQQLWPPAARVVAPQSSATFFGKTDELRGKLDELRKKEPGANMIEDFIEEELD